MQQSKSPHTQNHLYLFLSKHCVQTIASSKMMSLSTRGRSFVFQRQLVPEPRILSVKSLVQREGEQSSTSTLLTLGYGYCFPLGYKAPVNRGITMLGTNESFIIRKASLSPSGDHQWAMWECRSSSRINECYLKPTVEMSVQWPTDICPLIPPLYIYIFKQCVGFCKFHGEESISELPF